MRHNNSDFQEAAISKLTHIDDAGKVRMVDVSGKTPSKRTATAKGVVMLTPKVMAAIRDKATPKGDVFSTARIAGIMAAKKTADLIPLCHPLPLSSVEVDFDIIEDEAAIEVTAKALTEGQTGVEMEALTAVSVAALTLYDMVKGLDKGCRVTDIRLIEKTGGKSGTYKGK